MTERHKRPERRANRMGAGATQTVRAPKRDVSRAEPRTGGAVQAKTSWRQQADAWFAHHSNSAIESLVRLFQTPVQSIMTWMVIAIAVALPAALFVVFENVRHVGQGWQDSNQISVFLKKGVGDADAQALGQRWRQRGDVADVVYVSPAQALDEFRSGSGLGELANHLDENPLPGVLLVKPIATSNSPALLEGLQQALIVDPLVADIRLDMLWVKRLHQFTQVAERFVYALAILLALGVLLVIGNTIRMAIESRRDEIVVVKLVGATDAYVRRPFLYTGLWYGVGGGVLAALILAIVFGWLSPSVAQLAELYQSDFRLQGLSLIASLQVILVAGGTGLVGAWIAVARHLYSIQPK